MDGGEVLLKMCQRISNLSDDGSMAIYKAQGISKEHTQLTTPVQRMNKCALNQSIQQLVLIFTQPNLTFRPSSFTLLSNFNTVKAKSTTYIQNKYTRNILVSQSYLLGVVLCPLSSDTTIGPSSENGGLFLLIPLIPPHTSIIVSLVGPREPADGSQEERIRVCRKITHAGKCRD